MKQKVYIINLTLFCVSVTFGTLFGVIAIMTGIDVWARLAFSALLVTSVSGFIIRLIPKGE
jgi:hypothetical protein